MGGRGRESEAERVIDGFVILISVFTNGRTSMSVDLYVASGTMLGGSPMNYYVGSERVNFQRSSYVEIA